jgi:hypothetical protein
MPIKVNPGEPALQSAASDGQRHSPRQHNLNYTIWTLDAVSVSVPQLGRTLFNQSSHLGARPRSWGVLQTINQVIRARPAFQGAPHLSYNHSPPPTECKPPYQKPICPELRKTK